MITGATISTGFVRTGAWRAFLGRLLVRLENFRIKTHLRLVERELRRKDVSQLSADLQRERAKNLDRLHDYWTRGVFPKNLDFADRRMPYFKDAFGTPCAMAYLIEQSGERALVNSVAQSDNHVFINDIKGGPVLDWIEKSGLTQAEAAQVQPGYGPCGFGTDLVYDPELDRCVEFIPPVESMLPNAGSSLITLGTVDIILLLTAGVAALVATAIFALWRYKRIRI